jgi:isoleucyl-tRNA synthetase
VGQFFALYANIDDYDPARKEPSAPNLLDRWILSRLHSLVAAARDSLEAYDLTRGARMIQDFVLEDLSNWYVRRSRRRFWKSGDPADKRAAYDVLYECLRGVSRLLAPYTPFIAEEIHQHVVRPGAPDAEPASVHWCDFPQPDRAKIDEALERSMEVALRVVNLARAARNASSLRVRQPLRRVAVAGLGEREARDLLGLAGLVQDELNVKELSQVGDRAELVSLSVKPNFPVLGKKAGGAMKEIAAQLLAAPPDQVRSAVQGEGWDVEAGGRQFRLTAEDVLVQEASKAPWVAQSDGTLTVAIDTTLDEDLRTEGLVREFAHRIQALRKSADFDVTDRIRLSWELSAGLARACERFEGYIRDEVLAEELVSRAPTDGVVEEWTFDGERARVGIERVRKGG